ncbi:nucleotidyl transferase AbiEii/AbiGii toxin family protein [Rubneribacter sp.]
MYLHENQEDWSELVARTANRFNLAESFVIKDYFIYLALKSIARTDPEIVFKGGTCLSKCHRAIARFSEDVDLGLEVEHATEGQRKRMKAAVTHAIDNIGLAVANLNETRSRREFNRYLVPLPSAESEFSSNTLIIETAVMTPASPAAAKAVDNYLYRYCIEEGFDDVAAEYELEPFKIMASSIERTFVDKVFALCDYYLEGPIPPRQSRHIYDLHKLSPIVSFDEELAALFSAVRRQRKNAHGCPSAQDGVDTPSVLEAIIEKAAYRDDYERVTTPLLFEEVSYEKAVESLRMIAEFMQGLQGKNNRAGFQ